MYKVVKKSQASTRIINENKKAVNYITKDISKYLSFALLEATDCQEEEKTLYNRIYFALEGSLVLTFGEEVETLEIGDSCYIEMDTSYTITGTFKAAVINQPAFGTKQTFFTSSNSV